MVLFVIWMVFVLTVLIPWMVRHPHDDQHEHGHAGFSPSR
jgi:hypothetical protein